MDGAKKPSPRTPERLEKIRARQRTKKLYPIAQPCIICGEKGTRNHIDADIYNNNPSNIEWLCMKHHLMVDGQRATEAIQWFRTNHPDLWLEFHDKILAKVRENPEPARETIYKLKT